MALQSGFANSDTVASVTLRDYQIHVVNVDNAGSYQLERSFYVDDDVISDARYASLGDALRALASVVNELDA